MAPRVDVRLTLALMLAGCLSPPPTRITAHQYVVAVGSALRNGDIDLADEILARARARYPEDGAVRLWSAEVASMRWQDEDALHELMAARSIPDRGGFTEAELEGKIGDMLFRMGRYGESIEFLSAGQVGEMGAARKAWAEIAHHLPYLRPPPEIEVAELPLVEGPLPRLICSVGGEQQPFVLDTRATFTTLTNSMAAELPVSPVLAAGDAVDGTGRVFSSSVGVLRAFSLGGADVGPEPVLVVEDRALALRDEFGGPVRSPKALVGQNVLRRFRVTFDPARRSVVFQSRLGLDERESQEVLWVEENLLVAVTIEGRRLWFVLDTGASESSLTELGLRALPDGERRALESYRRVYSPSGTQFSVRKVDGLVLEVSEVRFRGVDLPVIEREPSAIFPLHGVLGADLVMRCRTTLDSGRIRIQPL